jgi:hypothetical protein
MLMSMGADVPVLRLASVTVIVLPVSNTLSLVRKVATPLLSCLRA